MNPNDEATRVEGDNQDVSQTGAGQVIRPDTSSVSQDTTQSAGVEPATTTAEPFTLPSQETSVQQTEFSPQQPSVDSSPEPSQPVQPVGGGSSDFSPSPQPMVGDMSATVDQPQQTVEPVQSVDQANQPGVISPSQQSAPSNAASQPALPSQDQTQSQQFAAQPVVPQQGVPGSEENPNKSYVLAVVLSFFLGGLGVDRFYLGKIGTGIAKLLTGGGFAIWYIVDLVLLVIGKLRDQEDARPLEGYAKYHKPFKIGLIVWLIVQLVSIVLLFTLLTLSSNSSNSTDSGSMFDLNTNNDAKAAIDKGLKDYHTENGYYMTPAEYADLKQSVADDLSDPNAVNGIKYEVFPAGCDNAATICNGFSLSTI